MTAGGRNSAIALIIKVFGPGCSDYCGLFPTTRVPANRGIAEISTNACLSGDNCGAICGCGQLWPIDRSPMHPRRQALRGAHATGGTHWLERGGSGNRTRGNRAVAAARRRAGRTARPGYNSTPRRGGCCFGDVGRSRVWCWNGGPRPGPGSGNRRAIPPGQLSVR